jgi:hypothetical protein
MPRMSAAVRSAKLDSVILLSTVVGPPLACTPCITGQMLAADLSQSGQIKVQNKGLPYLHTARLQITAALAATPEGDEYSKRAALAVRVRRAVHVPLIINTKNGVRVRTGRTEGDCRPYAI